MEKEEKAAEILAGCCQGEAAALAPGPILARMEEKSRRRALEQVPGLKGLLCCVFPYFDNLAPGNLSIYARGMDYHLAAGRRLDRACEMLKKEFPGFNFRGYTDVSPFPEVYACARAGLGAMGKNGLLLTQRWGSYVFCGVVASDLPLEGGREPCGCEGCGLCRQACPGGALDENGRLEQGRCLSALTQQRGELTAEQQRLIGRSGMIWGCDVCQRVCPANRAPERTELPEFLEQIQATLTAEELEGLSQREFRRQYGDRAFAWRGVAPLRRNLALNAAAQSNDEAGR